MNRIGWFGAAIIFIVGSWYLIASAFNIKQNSDFYSETSTVFASTILIQNSEIDDVYLYLVFPSGEASNPFDEGLAHYVEHLAWHSAFGGAKSERMSHSNAWTNHFSTGYWQKTNSGALDWALRDLVNVSKPFKVETGFALDERKIVLREYDFRVAERPLYSVFREMNQVLYGDAGLARSVIGEPAVISKYPLETAALLHKKSHGLPQATLLIYGNVSQERLETVIASLSDVNILAPDASPTSRPLIEAGKIQDRAFLSLPQLGEDTFLYRKVIPLDQCDVPAHCAVVKQLAENALNSSLPGGIAGPLRFDQFLARRFSFSVELFGQNYVEVSFEAHPDIGVALEDLDDVFHKHLHRTLKQGLTQETFDRIKSRLGGHFDTILEHERPSYNRDLVLDLLMSGMPIFSMKDQMDALESVQLEDVNQFLKSLLVDGREVTRLVSVER